MDEKKITHFPSKMKPEQQFDRTYALHNEIAEVLAKPEYGPEHMSLYEILGVLSVLSADFALAAKGE